MDLTLPVLDLTINTAITKTNALLSNTISTPTAFNPARLATKEVSAFSMYKHPTAVPRTVKRLNTCMRNKRINSN